MTSSVFTSFRCDTLDDLAGPIECLEAALVSGDAHPHCQISGQLMDAIIDTTPETVEGNLGGDFSERLIDPEESLLHEVAGKLTRVALIGCHGYFDDDRITKRLVKAGDARPHPDFGCSNIVNLTLRGQRVTIVAGVDELLVPGSLSVIPTIESRGYFSTLTHSVELVEPGVFLHVRAYDRKRNPNL